MNFYDRIERVQRIHQLIRNESTGAPKEFAEKIHLRERQLYNLLEELKCYGADIRYSAEHSSYYYANNVDISIEFNIKISPQ
ncbi:MAG: hypothetical protein LBU22_09360 [Dysgonamonadaceae bacterium]|jgi:predicted DNA-binding transcriptional regulator YafY|nr:hypothetical protein [Dysgonamonadaceae bacterium]